ncbi:MAG TPA: hypothetical protein DEF42_20830 [Desulfosporosinus sp.]|nr:hypothetical protein [Desulfosporosinus sp.]
MRGKNAIVHKLFTCFVITLLLLGYLPTPVRAGTSVVDHTDLHTPAPWPASFIPYTDTDGKVFSDKNGEISPTRADITSGPNLKGKQYGSQPSVYFQSDGTNLFFRMRIGKNPINKSKFLNTHYLASIGTLTVRNNHWESALVVGFNGNANGSYVYTTKNGNSIYKVYDVTASGSVADPNQGARVVPVSDGTGQYFLDFQVPISELAEFEDTNGNEFQGTTPIKLFYATSQANNLSVVNKDYVGTSDSGGTITPGGPAAPAVPTELAASGITQTSFTLTWTASPGATSYKVYKDGILYASPTTNTALITGLTASTTYSLAVSAVNANGEGAKSAALPVTTLPAIPTGPLLKVLEVQPGTTYDLSVLLLSGAFPNNPIDITQMSMAEFISKVEEINGKYDVVYIGNNPSGAQYSALGTDPTYLPQGGSNNGSGTSKEYYSDNDITNRRAKVLKDFVYSKQLTIFAQSIFDSRKTHPKLYDNFIGFKNNSTYPNFVTVNTNIINNLVSSFSNYVNSNVGKRPVLTMKSQPSIYDGTDASYQEVKSLSFRFDINNKTSLNNMVAKLYIDMNGDGIYNASDDYAGRSEVVYEMGNLKSGTGFTLNFHLPDSFVGLQPWKLELTDTSTATESSSGSKSYVTGATAFKGNSGDEVIIRLLQLIPNNNTFSIYSLSNINGQNLLYKDKVYKINVTEMNVSNFNAAYNNPTPTPVSAKVNGVNTTAPTILNGNYDMLIMGFADVYGNSDLTNTKAIDALKNFIATNQSVMLTHDTLTFQVNSPNTWGYNITQNFRKLIGQQRYYRTAPDSNRTYDPMPNASKDSYGFTNLTLGRYNNGVYDNGKTFETTTETHKINDNLVTQFPFPLGDITVSATHFQYFQLDLEDKSVVPVYTLTNAGSSSIYNHPGDGRNDYYTYTKGNITFSGTGHSTVNSLEEKKMFVNTIIKASRGANHAPTLEVHGITDGMNIANTLPAIDFSFTATDIDLNDQYQNADIYLATSSNGTTFSEYQKVKHYSAEDPDVSKRIKSGIPQSVSVPTVSPSIEAYKVKVVVFDSNNAEITKEIRLNSVEDPQISIQSFNTSLLVGDRIDIPVNVTATATVLKETFKNISLRSVMTKPDNSTPTVYNDDLPDLTFNPSPSWPNNVQEESFSFTFNDVGNYSILNTLNYDAYYGISPHLSGRTARTNQQSFRVSVDSGKIDVEVLDTRLRGIPGVTVNVTGTKSLAGITADSGLASFTDLSSGNYTVTLVVPEGFSIEGSTSKTVTLSPNNPREPIKFGLSGSLLSNPSITATGGGGTTDVFLNDPLLAKVGLTLNRPASFIKLDLNNNLSDGSTMNVAITKVKLNTTDIDFIVDPSDPMKIIPKLSNSSFPSGAYTIDTTITLNGSSVQAGQSYLVTLTQMTSARDATTGYEDNIDSVPPPLTVNVVSATLDKLISNAKITTKTGSNQISVLENVPIQGKIQVDLSRPATYLKMDFSNSNVKVGLSNLYCDYRGSRQQISFEVDPDDPTKSKLKPIGPNTVFPAGTYSFDALITEADKNLVIKLIATAQDAGDENFIDSTETESEATFLTITIGTPPPLH